jgi:hypothetical protein
VNRVAPRSLAALLAAALAGCAHAPAARPAAAPASTRPDAPTADQPAGVAVAIEVADRGTLVFQVPSGWRVTSGEGQPPLPATLRFEPPAGHFVLLVTPLWDPEQPGRPLGPDVARALVEETRDRALETALERELPLVALPGTAGVGWYFTSTDRELSKRASPPGPEEYRAMAQGAVSIGTMVLAFTLLDDGDGPQRAGALALVQGAVLRPPPGDPAAEPEQPARSHRDPSGWTLRGGEPVELGLPGRAWTVQLDLAGWRVADPIARSDGSAVSVIARRESDGMVLTTTLADSGGRRSAEACRDQDWSRIETVPGVTAGARFVKDGVAAIGYTAGSGAETTSHLSVWRYRDGVCIHAHASQEGAPARALPALERATLIRYGEPL